MMTWSAGPNETTALFYCVEAPASWDTYMLSSSGY